MNNNEILKIAILGDSISEGLGSKKYNYINSLEKNLKRVGIKSIIKNFSHTGTTINYALEKIEDIKNFSPDCILIFYGNVEAIIRPDLRKKTIIKMLLPKRYRKIFMLDPRPFYSNVRWKKIFQYLDNIFRYIMRRVIIKLNGSYRLMELDEFKNKYSQFLKEALLFSKKIICISNVRIDERLFPGTTDSMNEFCKIIYQLTQEYNVSFIALNEWQKKYEWAQIYGNDHYHPNKSGYELIGEFFANQILKEDIFKKER